jgi:hypothetical protein
MLCKSRQSHGALLLPRQMGDMAPKPLCAAAHLLFTEHDVALDAERIGKTAKKLRKFMKKAPKRPTPEQVMTCALTSAAWKPPSKRLIPILGAATVACSATLPGFASGPAKSAIWMSLLETPPLSKSPMSRIV